MKKGEKLMKRFIAGACAALLIALPAMGMPLKSSADNPIAQNVFTPDPAPMVYGDTLYI